MSVKVSPKYQVVIPESVRRFHDFKPGQEVDVIDIGGVVCIVPVRPLEDIIASFKGKIKPKDSSLVREKRDRKI